MICREFEKDLNLDLRMDIQGRFRRDVAQLIIDELNLPITVDEYECRLLSFYKEIFPKSKLKPGIHKQVLSGVLLIPGNSLNFFIFYQSLAN